MRDDTDGIYDDGEWVSWEWINGQIHRQDLAEEYPLANPDIVEVFEALVSDAQNYYSLTGRYLQIWGELGELYAEIKHGIDRHKPHTQGSDGRMGNDMVEIKTISPEKGVQKVMVGRSGNFNKLLVVKINDQFEFESRMLDRKDFCKGKSKAKGVAQVAWQSMPAPETEKVEETTGLGPAWLYTYVKEKEDEARKQAAADGKTAPKKGQKNKNPGL
jgi:hypothetical protein